MRHMNKTTKALGIGLTLLTMTSCYQKELCYTHPHTQDVNVVFDWKNDPTAKPATMSLYTFTKDEGKDMRYEFTDYHGGKAKIALGVYDALCINSDGPRNYFRNIEKRETFEVYTQDAKKIESISEMVVNLPRARGAENERVVFHPDKVWSDVTQLPFVLTQNEGIQNVIQTLTLYPKPLFCTYTVEIRNAQNLKYAQNITATLSGLAGGVMAETATPTEETVTVAFDAEKKDATTVRGKFYNFGYNSKQTKPEHKLAVYVVLANGTRKLYTYDVTDQIRKAPDPRNVLIILDGLPLPRPITNGSGFKPTVSKWDVVEIDIKA